MGRLGNGGGADSYFTTLLIPRIIALSACLAIVLVYNVLSGCAGRQGHPRRLDNSDPWPSRLVSATRRGGGFFVRLHYEQFFYLYLAIPLILAVYLTIAGQDSVALAGSPDDKNLSKPDACKNAKTHCC